MLRCRSGLYSDIFVRRLNCLDIIMSVISSSIIPSTWACLISIFTANSWSSSLIRFFFDEVYNQGIFLFGIEFINFKAHAVVTILDHLLNRSASIILKVLSIVKLTLILLSSLLFSFSSQSSLKLYSRIGHSDSSFISHLGSSHHGSNREVFSGTISLVAISAGFSSLECVGKKFWPIFYSRNWFELPLFVLLLNSLSFERNSRIFIDVSLNTVFISLYLRALFMSFIDIIILST